MHTLDTPLFEELIDDFISFLRGYQGRDQNRPPVVLQPATPVVGLARGDAAAVRRARLCRLAE